MQISDRRLRISAPPEIDLYANGCQQANDSIELAQRHLWAPNNPLNFKMFNCSSNFNLAVQIVAEHFVSKTSHALKHGDFFALIFLRVYCTVIRSDPEYARPVCHPGLAENCLEILSVLKSVV